MATSSRGSGGRSSSRGGGGGGGGRYRSSGSGRGGSGGGGNPMAIVMAVVGVVLVIVLVVVMSGGKDKPTPTPAPPPAPAPQPPPTGPKPPERGPKPVLPAAIVAKAKTLIEGFKVASAEGKKMSDEAMKAKTAGDQDLWQQKLEAAREILKSARDEWLKIEDEVDEFLDKHPSKGWEADDVIDAYLKSESSQVQKLLDEPLSAMAKSGRGH